MNLGLANMRRLMAELGNPEKRFRSVIVAGTNGKGSVSAFLASILQAGGVRVGRYTSPHVYSVTERICVSGQPVTLSAMEEAASRVVPLHQSIPYSYFEAITAIAYQIFAEERVEIAVLEVGLGGRFDATNIVEPEVSVLTGVSLDHRRLLGDTEEEILREKLGITRPGIPLVCGRLSPELMEIVEQKCGRERIPLDSDAALGTAELTALSFDGMRARLRTESADYGEITLPFIGEHQLANALVAVRAAELVLGRVGRLREATEATYLPGRFEVIRFGDKIVVFDVAHNDEALIATLRTLTALSPRAENGIILGVLRRKELSAFPAELSRRVIRAHLIEPVAAEAFTAPELLGALGMKNVRNGAVDVVLERFFEAKDDWARFTRRILSPQSPCGVILVTGSHRTVEVVGRSFLAARRA
jgi:dihydrofolate synthase/folylpolyglutamate synthase